MLASHKMLLSEAVPSLFTTSKKNVKLKYLLQVSEILDSELLGEGLIPTLQHAHDNLLVENPLTVPYRATTYGQVISDLFSFNVC